MRTSHKHTHTQLPGWLRSRGVRLSFAALVLGGLAVVIAVQSGRWTANANELEAARAQLQQAKAQYLSNPTKEATAEFDKALAAYKAALKTNPAGAAAAPQVSAAPYVSGARNYGVTSRVSDLPPGSPAPNAAKKIIQSKNKENELPFRNFLGSDGKDSAVQTSIPPGPALVTNPIQNFDGPDMDIGNGLFGGRFAPPDTNADVGPNHVVVSTNGGTTIYSKTGTVLVPQFRLSQIMPFPAAVDDDGDPVVLYDPLADRWILTQFGLTVTNNSTHEFIAISQTSDPTGAYYAYDFLLAPGRAGDYPHLGVWPDAIYMSTNDFNTAFTAFLGAGLYAFDRKKMLAGDPTATLIGFSTGTTDGGMLPTDIDGVVPPPVGAPNLFIEFDATEFGAATDLIRVFEFRPNFANPAASTVTTRPDIPTAAFDASQPSSRAVVEQPAPAVAADNLDVIADRLMHRLAYRTLPGGTQSYVLNFTVNVTGVAGTTAGTYQAGVRWMELRRDGAGAVTINQQATYAPGAVSGTTGRNLWMAAVAQDGEGNIGLAASASSTTLVPTAIYTGRLAGDAANTLPQGEVDALAAVTRGVQTGTGNRWGDYSSLSVDPADECTFWGAFEYVDSPTAAFDWNSRVFSFKVNPACVTAPKGTIQGQATNSSLGGAPISGVSVTTPEGFFRSTNGSGNYSMSVAPGTYTVTCSKAGFSTATGTVTVAGGGTATFNCALAGVPIVGLASSAITAEDCAVDGKADPGETLSVSVCLSNTGGANPTNLVATLAATGGVTNPSAPQSYGALAAGGPAVCRTFSFRVNPALLCGNNVVASFTLADGATNLGNFTITYQSGSLITSLTQNFDSVTPPALPAGWTTATTPAAGATNPLPVWVSTTSRPDSGTISLFTPDVDTGVTGQGQVNEVVSPAIAITTNAAQVSFRNQFNMESGFDGGVLEIKIGAGAFTDIVTAGGTFVTGGYTGTLSSSFGSPLGGRSAWTGVSAGTGAAPAYITTTINLPAAAAGQNIQLRWRSASDDSVIATGLAGWWVDTLSVKDGFACCAKITPGASLADPLSCTGPGNVVSGVATVTNPGATTLTGGTVTIALPVVVGQPPQLLALPGACTATVAGVATGTCAVVNATTIQWTGSLPGNATLTINYQAQVGDVQSGTQLCATISGGFTGVGLTSVQACVVVNCQPAGPGQGIPTTVQGGGVLPPSDQKPGSVLLYPVYTSASDATKQNSRISLTNTNPSLGAYVHLFFVDGDTCSVADAFICLTPNQTTTFLASDLDPGTTGYMVALAVDRAGCPTNFNYLIGDEYVKFSSGHAGNLGAESVPAIAGGLQACLGSTAVVRFDGVSYAGLPRTVALDNIPSRADGNDTLLILDRINGDLLTTASTLNNLFGLLYNDTEQSLSFSLKPGTCQYRSSLTNNFPRVTPRFEQFIAAGRSGWLKLNSTDDQAIIGASFNLNANSGSSAGAFNGAHNLHKMTLTTGASYVVPVLPVSCQ